MLKKTLATVALSSVLASGVSLGATAHGATSRPSQPPSTVGVATSVKLTTAVANASFTNQYGATRTLGQLSGKTVFLVPVLTLCGDTCPFTTGDLLQLQDRLSKDKVTNDVIIGIDVDPYRDSVARLRAYSSLIGATFEIWTPQGATTTPNGDAGSGDVNLNLTAIETFLGWSVSVVPEGTPAMTDWMKPYRKLTYDINHSDGFWVIDATQTVRFVSGNLPCFSGTIAKALSKFMGQKSNIYKNVNKGGWTPSEALQALAWVTGVNLK